MFNYRIASAGLAAAALFCSTFSIAIAQEKSVSPAALKGIQYGFDRATAPEKDPRSQYVIFYGYGKQGWNAEKKAPYPSEKREIYSRIYHLANLPKHYEWRALNKAPTAMLPSFHDYLIKEYKFTSDLHGVSYLIDNSISRLEEKLADHIATSIRLSKSTIIPDTKFTFSYVDKDQNTPIYGDPNNHKPYVFEYK